MNTLEPSTVPRPTFQEILRRAAGPFALFTLVLAGLLFLSWFLLLPRFMNITVKGQVLAPSSLTAYVHGVQGEIASTEKKRDAFIMPLDQTPYAALMQEKINAVSPAQIHASITGIARTLVPGQSDAIFLSSVTLLPLEGAVIVSGDVRNVGLNSMTVLAQFIDAVSNLEFISSVERPAFTREQDALIGAHSPFTFRAVFP